MVNKKIKVSLFYTKKKQNKTSIRTVGITKDNLNFIIKNNVNINPKGWSIRDIKIYNEVNKIEEIFNFSALDDYRFSIFKNDDVYKKFENSLRNNKNFTIKEIKNNLFYNKILSNNKYDIIINSETNNQISKKFFYKKINKNYNSCAFTTIIKHNFCENKTARQIFTKNGPIAFLPISNTKTSIVFSILKSELKFDEKLITDLIKKYNLNYKIKSFSHFEKFNLKFKILRKYYHKNILTFGDLLHRIHPLAGQGLNMSIRDVKILSNIIDNKLELGLPLDVSVIKEFQDNTKHMNFFFANGIDLIHEYFKFENKFGYNYSKKIFKYFEKNKLFNKYISQFADRGLSI